MSFVMGESGPWTDIDTEASEYIIFRCGFPVNKGHLLYVPKVKSSFILGQLFESAYNRGQRMVAAGECDAFNIGMNCGEEAGQTIQWPHIHLIPRHLNDTPDPVGGVRNVIPSQGNYRGDTYVPPEV